jgi:outer membrane protein TolC
MTRCLLYILLMLSCSSPLLAETVDLRKAELLALERNLDLRAQVFETRASAAAVRREYGIYDPVAVAEAAKGVVRERINLTFLSDTPKNVFEYHRFDFFLTQILPTGAELRAGFTNLREDSNSTTRLFNPSYQSELQLSLIQPLLRDFGRTLTERRILFAIKDKEISVQDLREEAFVLLTRVRDAYFDVLRFRDILDYRETSVELARRVMDENRARVDVGVMPPVEILEAEVGLKLRERELLDSQREYQDAIDNLAVLLNATGTIQVAEEPLGQPEIVVDEERGFASALEKRPDILRRIKEIERLGLERKIARNQTLPALDLSGSYSHRGLGGDYEDDLDDVGSDEFRNWEILARLSYPIGNREARNELLRTRLRLQGSHARLAQLKEEVLREIRAAIRLLDVSGKKIEVASRGRDLAEEQLRTLLKRKEVGLATTRDVLEGEEDLAEARTELTAAFADYNKAVTDYLRVTGQLLEHVGIRFTAAVEADGDGVLLGVGGQ